MSNEQKEVQVQEAEYQIIEVPTATSNLPAILGAEIDTQIATAKQYPRSLAVFRQRALERVTRNQEVAESCQYGLPRGRDVIKGPSVRLAEIIAISYGNLRYGSRVVSNNGRQITAQGVCFDLESNVACTIEVTRSIMQHEWKYDHVLKKRVKTGRMVPMNEDMQTLVANAACAIAKRNAIFSVVPKSDWDEPYQESQRVALGTEATLVDRRTKAVAFFVARGVTEEQIYLKLEVKGMDDITLEKLAQLTAFKTSLKNEEGSLENIFTVDDQKDAGAAATSATLKKIKDNLKNKKPGKDSAGAATGGLEAGLAGDKNPQ
jgi:hypothetical protein